MAGAGPWTARAAKIAAGQQFSELIDLEGYHFLGLRLPAAMTGVSFTVWAFGAPGASGDQAAALADALAALGAGPGSFQQVFGEDGVAVSIPFAAATCVGIGALVMARLAAFRFIALKSSAVEGVDRLVGYSLKA